MSDFISRLAEKALGMTPQVRPVIAPVFSPERGVSGSFIEATEWVDSDFPRPDMPSVVTDAPGKPLQAVPPDLQGSENLRRQLPTPRAAAEPSTSASTQPTTSPPSVPPTLKPEVVQSLHEQIPVVGGQPPSLPITTTAQTLPDLDTPTATAGLDRQVILVPDPRRGGEEDDYAIIALETEAEFDRSSDLQPHQLPEPQPLIRPAITPTRQQRVSSAPRTKEWLEAQEAAGFKTHLLPTGNEAEMPVEPAIHVTIGRVDVRLVQPPAAAKPPPTHTTTPPALSLDEYLKKRSDGRQ